MWCYAYTHMCIFVIFIFRVVIVNARKLWNLEQTFYHYISGVELYRTSVWRVYSVYININNINKTETVYILWQLPAEHILHKICHLIALHVVVNILTSQMVVSYQFLHHTVYSWNGCKITQWYDCMMTMVWLVNNSYIAPEWELLQMLMFWLISSVSAIANERNDKLR